MATYNFGDTVTLTDSCACKVLRKLYYFFYLVIGKSKPRFDFAHLAEAVSREVDEMNSKDGSESKDAQIISHSPAYFQDRLQ